MVAGDFRKGVTIEIDGKVYMVVDFQHVKPGKGAAFVRTKLKNVVTGQVLEQTFNPTDKYPDARIERKEMQYSYNDGNLYYFMDMDSFDMLPNFVELEVASTEPGIQGDTSKAGNKPATLETGYNIQVPLFVNTGDKIRVDTRTGTYMERVK